MAWYWIACILLVAGVAGGLLSTMAGMASLVTYPVLLALGLPPVSANVTNTAGLVFTGIGSAISSRKELRSHQRLTMSVTVWALLGAIIGSLLLTVAPASTFEHIVPFLIALAGVLMLLAGRSKPETQAKPRPRSPRVTVAKNVAIGLVGLYIGYFGASAGVILLAILAISLDQPFAVSNAIKNFTAFVANVFSLVIYAVTTKVYWLMVIPLGAGLFIGGYAGPIVVRHVPVRLLQRVIAFGAFGLAAYFFYDAYIK